MNSQTEQISQDALRELYHEWSEDREGMTPRPLQEWMAQYPQYKQELMRWELDEPMMRYADTLPPDLESGNAFREKAHTLIAEWRSKYEANLPTEDTETETHPPAILTSLNDAAKRQNLRFPQFAKTMGVSLATLMKLEERQIIAESIPVPFLTRLADTLRVALDDLRFYLQQSPQQTAGAMYKADAPPETGEKITFEAALAFDNEMTPEQKATALSKEVG